MRLIIKDLWKYYGSVLALQNVSLEVEAGEFVCLLGPSGCGKTTLLRIVAGLEDYSAGTLTLGDRDLLETDAQHRGFGIVFQSYSLFPNMTAAENVGYGLKIRKWPAARIAEKVRGLMDLVRIPELADRYPHQLSGGQQQRVAIARAIAVDPKLLLLDEPLSALDARVRAEMRLEIRDVQRRLGIPTIMVTHDQEEALTMADKIVCMNRGQIEQVGTPHELYAHPRTRFVADFVGVSNLLPPQAAAALAPGLAERMPAEDGPHLLALRPEEIVLRPQADGAGEIRAVTFLGNIRRLQVAWRDQLLTVEQHRQDPVAIGDTVALEVAPTAGSWVKA